MITVTIDDNNKFCIQGSFHMGYAGVYINDAGDNEQLELLDDFNEVSEEWDIVKKRLDVSKATKEEIAKCLTDYFNEYEQRIQKNIKQVNDNFLLNVFSNIVDMGIAFWKIEEITNADQLPELAEDEGYGEVIFEGSWKEMGKMEDEFYNKPNDGSIVKSDVESAVRRMFPAFNLDQLLAGIKPEHICFHDGGISFQCSDSLNYEILCSAYDELDENLTFTDWHNF